MIQNQNFLDLSTKTSPVPKKDREKCDTLYAHAPVPCGAYVGEGDWVLFWFSGCTIIGARMQPDDDGVSLRRADHVQVYKRWDRSVTGYSYFATRSDGVLYVVLGFRRSFRIRWFHVRVLSGLCRCKISYYRKDVRFFFAQIWN